MCIHWSIGKIHYYVLSLAKGPRRYYGIFSKNPNDAWQASYLWDSVVKCYMSYLILRWTPKDLNCQKTGEVCRLQANPGLPILRAPQVMCLQSSHLQNLFPGLLSNQDWPGGRLPHSTSLWPPMLEAKRFLPQFLRNVSLSVVDKQFEQAYVAYVTANSMNHSSCSIWLLPDCQGRGGDIFFTQMHQPVHCPGRFELLHMVCNFWICQGRKS